jgi:hypothetical protein
MRVDPDDAPTFLAFDLHFVIVPIPLHLDSEPIPQHHRGNHHPVLDEHRCGWQGRRMAQVVGGRAADGEAHIAAVVLKTGLAFEGIPEQRGPQEVSSILERDVALALIQEGRRPRRLDSLFSSAIEVSARSGPAHSNTGRPNPS